MDFHFHQTAEYRLLDRLMTASENGDFENIIQFDVDPALDNWHKTMIGQVRKMIEEEDEYECFAKTVIRPVLGG
jgi:hypothetical protein